MQGHYLLHEDRPIDRVRWAMECFPEWGRWLNREIEQMQVPEGNWALWWLGGMGFVFKSPGGAVFLVDNYAGPSHYTEYAYCGVCRTSGAETIDWIRLNPQVIDIFAFGTLDAVLCSHHHADHCDIYTLKATAQTTNCRFLGPLSAVERMRNFNIPEERITTVRPGDRFQFKDVELEILPNYDRIATMTGTDRPGKRRPFDEVAVSFFFKTTGGTLLHLADTLYDNAYVTLGNQYNIDVVTFNIGHNAPGATDKMTPYDAYRVSEALKAKLMLPMHWDNWGNTQIDPRQVEEVVRWHRSSMKTVVLQWGACFVYPRDQDIGHYRYPDWRERYRPDHSWEYGRPAQEAGLR